MITVTDIEGMRRSAEAALGDAVRAQDLARAIDRRRQEVLTRGERAASLHTPEVWTSSAATRSRVELAYTVGGAIRLLGEQLRQTSMLLDAHAGELEADARSLRRRAEVAEERIAAAQRAADQIGEEP